MMKSKRILYIDGQLFQTAARDRGMGRYALSLIRAIQDIQNNKYIRIVLILSSNLRQSTIYESELVEILPKIEVIKLDLWTTNNHSYDSAARHNITVLQKIIDQDSTPADYFIPALFQEPTVCVFPQGAYKILLFYDIVPYLYHGRYSPLIPYENYLKRFKTVFIADSILSISQTVADDLKVYLGISKEKIVNIDGAAIKAIRPQSKPKSFNYDNFILMPTSDDPRKNNLRAVLGFEEFRSAHHKKDDIKLVVTSTISKREREHLSLFSKHIYFTGNLAEEELDWLYANCSAVLFVPEYEGLGLPILEAVSEKKKIVCSSISVFREISETAFYYCDHENQESIARALSEAFSDGASIDEKIYMDISKYYSWNQTANRFLASPNVEVIEKKRERLAVFIPTPAGLSAIGKVVAETHHAMQEEFEVDYYVENGLYGSPVRPDYLQFVANCYSAQTFSAEKYADYKAVIYHIGNGDYHLESIKNALYLPGYIIMHDTNLKEAYRVFRDEGIVDEQRITLEELINDKSNTDTSEYITTLVNSQLGIMAHSEYAKDAISRVTYTSGINLATANLPTAVPTIMPWRNPELITIGLAGIIADVKGLGLIERIAETPEFSKCTISLFGFNYTSNEVISKLRSHANISLATNLSDFDFSNSISKLDIFMNYRTKYNGETSLSTLEAMRQGVVVIVRNIGWYSELPDDAVIKVSSEEEAMQKLSELINDVSIISQTSKKAKEYVQSTHDHRQYVKSLSNLINLPTNNQNSELSTLLKGKKLKNTKQYLGKFNQIRINKK
jgi:glycosyltransferase involved in cell wall biosynthesis